MQFCCPFETPLKGSREPLKTYYVVPQNTLILTGSSPHTLRYIPLCSFFCTYTMYSIFTLQNPMYGFISTWYLKIFVSTLKKETAEDKKLQKILFSTYSYVE